MSKREVLLDTNMLLVPFRFMVDIFAGIGEIMQEPWDPAVSTGIVRELEDIASGRDRPATEARLALDMLGEKGVKVVVSGMPPDEWLKKRAKENGAVVATNDRELIKSLKALGIRVISLKSRSRLGVV